MTLLREADLVACEDTRSAGRLLSLLGLTAAALTPYHEHNADKAGPALLARLREGATVALVSDAGSPLISDPGYRLVRACVAEGLPVTSLPGPSALLCALQLSALPCDRFLFAGFLPAKSAARRTALAGMAAVPVTLIFYEAPHRLASALADMAACLGDREAAVARELTKLFEEVRRGRLLTLAAGVVADPPKGEIVVVVGPPEAGEATAANDLEGRLRDALRRLSPRDAAAAVAAETGAPRRQVYALAVRLAGKAP
jgi:16S rRNA (cytidine1402-2'-O)-methyltransferase